MCKKKRFAGTCYEAANLINVGQTKGREKLGLAGKNSVPSKDIWVYLLNKKNRVLLKNQIMNDLVECLLKNSSRGDAPLVLVIPSLLSRSPTFSIEMYSPNITNKYRNIA